MQSQICWASRSDGAHAGVCRARCVAVNRCHPVSCMKSVATLRIVLYWNVPFIDCLGGYWEIKLPHYSHWWTLTALLNRFNFIAVGQHVRSLSALTGFVFIFLLHFGIVKYSLSQHANDAVVWADREMKWPPGRLWVHDWETPECVCVCQIRTSFWHSRGESKGAAAVSLIPPKSNVSLVIDELPGEIEYTLHPIYMT